MQTENLISAADALNFVGNPAVTFIDASWYLPAQGRDGEAEYKVHRIPGAIYFDIDKIADPDTDLPHMLPHPEVFAHIAGSLGISSDTLNIVYDGPGLFSAPRVWWTLKVMGARHVKILKGGFDKWRQQDLPIETGKPRGHRPAIFDAKYDSQKVASISTVEANLKNGTAAVLDARPHDRFNGTSPEPREGLRSGHIPHSKSLPASKLVKDGMLADMTTLERHFRDLRIEDDTPVITTCGSGVTAAILALALEETGRTNVKLFDGSWAEWGKQDGPPIETNG